MANCTMTRQHFQRIAEIIGEQIAEREADDELAAGVILIAIRHLRGTNGNFDSQRFSTECFKQARLNGWLLDAERVLIAPQRDPWGYENGEMPS